MLDVLTPDSESGIAEEDATNVRTLSSTQEEWRRRKLLEKLHFEEVPQSDARQL